MSEADLFPETVTKAAHGAEWWSGNWQCRNWHGYIQSRESGRGRWSFQIEGFSGPEDGDGEAHVYMIQSDESLKGEPHPIDARNRVLIRGKRYSRDHWNH